MNISLRYEDTGDTRVITVEGDYVDETNAMRLRREIAPLLEGASKVVLDLGQVTFMASSGVGALLYCLQRMKAAGGSFSLCNLTPTVAALLKMVGLERVMPVLTGPCD